MEPGPEIHERIRQAADALYQENECAAFPTVDAVRKRARVNMNDASTGMRAWRRAQAANVQAPAVQIPEKLQQAIMATTTTLWSEALALAGESLRAAQANWEQERVEANALAQQVGDAFEAQAAQLDALQQEHSRSIGEMRSTSAALVLLQEKHAEALQALASSQTAASEALTKATEVEKRAVELRHELDLAHDTIAALRREAADERRSHEAMVSDLTSNLVHRLEKAGIVARPDLRVP